MATWTRALTTDDEGSGNGIDADTVDGKHGSAFALLTGSTFTGDVDMTQASNVALTLDSTGGGSSRFLLNSQDSNTEYGEIYFQTNDTTKAKIYHHRDGILYLQTGGTTNALTLDASQNATFAGNVEVANGKYLLNRETRIYDGTTWRGRLKGISTGVSLQANEVGGDNLELFANNDVLLKTGSGTVLTLDGLNSTFGGTIQAANGSAAAPAYAFSSQASTGMYKPGTSQLYFSVAGTRKMRVEASQIVLEDDSSVGGTLAVSGDATFDGDVTIGDASAKTSLTIDGAGSGWTGADIIFQTDHANRGGGMFIYNTATDREWYWGTPYQTSNEMHLCYESTGSFTQQTAETPHSVFSVNTNGYAEFAGEITVAGGNDYSATFQNDVKILDSGSNPRLLLGDDVGGTGYGEINWHSSTNAIRLGTATAGANTLILDQSGNATFAGELTVNKTGNSGPTEPTVDFDASAVSGDGYIRTQVGAFSDAECGFISKNATGSWITGYMLHGSDDYTIHNLDGGGAVLVLGQDKSATFAGTVTAPTFVGALTGNAATATVLATARNIAGNSFNGSAAITIDIEDLANVTVSDSAATGGSTGDIWIEY